MGRDNLESLVTSFTPEGDFLAILSPPGIVKIWNTSNGDLLEEWKESDVDSDVSYSCLACSFIGSKRRKERATFLLALGTDAGDILAINVFTGERMWTFTGCHPGGTAGLSFANKGRSLHTVGADGVASELDSKTGEVIQKFKASKRPVSSFALSYDEKILAIASSKIRVFRLENKMELQKFSADLGAVQHIAVSDGGKAIVMSGFGEKQLQVWECDSSSRTITAGPILSMRHPPLVLECKNSCKDEDGLVVMSGFGEKQLQVWECDSSSRTITAGPILSMRHPPLVLECKNSCKDEDGLVVLSVSESGIAYLWDLKTISQDEVNPTKITVKSVKAEADQQKSGSARKSRIPVIAGRLHALEKDGQISVLIAYGSTDHPQFNLLDITNPGEDIAIIANDMTLKTVTPRLQENGDHGGIENSVMGGLQIPGLEVTDVSIQKKKVNKKRAASDPDLATSENTFDVGDAEVMNGLHVDDDLNEPTMGEKLASLNVLNDDKANNHEKHGSSLGANPPSADSVHVLLKQALHADDHALLLDCLYTQDEKVIAKSTSLLNPFDVLKLLDSLVSLIQSRGAVLVCALPWLRNLLLQHASGIMSQESSLLALNSLYQLIESRVSTFQSALQLSSCLDYLFSGISDDGPYERSTITPIIYEDKDDSDEEEPEDAMETDQDSEEVIEAVNGFSDFEGSDDG